MRGRTTAAPWLVAVAVLSVLTIPPAYRAVASPAWGIHAAAKSQKKLAEVRYIYRGLAVKPPKQPRQRGKVKMPLYNQYFLQTQVKQRASIRFHDGTMLHMNQATDATLTSPHTTVVKKGMVDELVAPGTDHRVQTATAVAAAIGTNFVVKMIRKATIFVVVHGAVTVSNKYGPSQVVKTSQASLVLPKQAPQPPQHVNVAQYVNWTNGMPAPKLGENVALDANGGHVVGSSSTYKSATQGDFWEPQFVIDGRLDWGWESAPGHIGTGGPATPGPVETPSTTPGTTASPEWIRIGFRGNKVHTITGVLIDPASTHDVPPIPSADLKDFQIRVSTTGTADSDFTTVYSGQCKDQDVLQKFTFTSPVQAKYLELTMLSNWGSPDFIAVAELEVIGTSL